MGRSIRAKITATAPRRSAAKFWLRVARRMGERMHGGRYGRINHLQRAARAQTQRTPGLYPSFPIDMNNRGMQKKRSHPRKGMIANAVMVTEDRAVPCCVRDLSPGGARLTFRDINLVPREFELLIRSTGDTYRAQ